MDSLSDLSKRIDDFVNQRHWKEFQTPKNLVMALTAEVGELNECFMWLSPEESRNMDDKHRHAVGEEMSDVLIYLARLADEMGIDLVAAAHAKCDKNNRKYPKEAFQGETLRPHEYKER
ncbi:nucleotide pyrophosphohydrolase [Pseudodesulfovibrio sp.]|uniref:nucleotide pyrophosphohydrolase n=1 Tax=unclassified Pseudodesulfovibrio TaxID=2661612 RepID=UPI003AFF9D8E